MKNELFLELYQCFSGKVAGYISSRVESSQDAEELVSRVFLNVYQNIDDLFEEKEAYCIWIYVITYNEVINYYRKQARKGSPSV